MMRIFMLAWSVVSHAVGFALAQLGSHVALLLALAGLIVAALVLRWHRLFWRALSPGPLAPVRLLQYPSLSIIRPVRGDDVGAEDNFRAALDTGYPGDVETLFVFDDERDPGLPIARRVVDEHHAAGRPGRAEVIIASAPPPGRTGKLNAMIVGEERARGTLISFGDSDTRPSRQVLRGVVEALMTNPDAGSAFAPVVVNQPVRAAGDALYALMQNALYSPLAAHVAGRAGTLPFIMGQLMVLKPSALAAIGGLRAAEGQLVDDMALGRMLDAAGYRNVMSRAPLSIATGAMTVRAFLPIYRRWMLFSHNGLPLSFTWRQWMSGASFFVALGLTAWAGAIGAGLAALPSLAALVMVGASQLVLQRRAGGAPIPPRLWWTAWAVWLLAPAIVAATLARHDVRWRGRVYQLGHDAALAGPRAARPAA
jgi:ceramide glucosyltransferase